MAEYFECLRCGTEHHVVSRPPKCPECGSGNGLLSGDRRPKKSAPLADEAQKRKGEKKHGKS